MLLGPYMPTRRVGARRVHMSDMIPIPLGVGRVGHTHTGRFASDLRLRGAELHRVASPVGGAPRPGAGSGAARRRS